MNRLFNMSVPPKSSIVIEIKPISKYLVFDPNVLCELLCCKRDVLLDSIKEYIEKHPNYLDTSPSSYLFALKKEKYDNYDYLICKDVDLLLSVFSKTVDNMYIPNRQPILINEKFDNSLLFMESEILNEK